jgi:autotransporter-associated beta strand protein
MALTSFQEFYDAFVAELQSQRPDITDTQIGSLVDVLSGVFASGLTEVTATMVDEFKKTYFATADGPEVTGGRDYLEELAVDHFGEAFARPEAVKSTGTVTFSRANTDAGNVTIPEGTVVKTSQSATGTSQRFETEAEVILTGLTINASVRAIVAGIAGNVQPSQVTQIESTLTDPSVTVNNSAAFAGGKAAENDAEYRETIKLLLQTLKGGTLSAIEAAALTVGGVEMAKGIEFLQYVKEWDLEDEDVVGDYFAIPRARLYIADANGTASQTLIDDVTAKVATTRAAGIRVDVIGATAFTQNWTASLSLNPSGPNFGLLSTDTTLIKDAMRKYIQDLPIGTGFNRTLAKNYIMAIFGPSGTNDLTNFTTTVPTGNVAGVEDQKIIPGTMSTV